MSTLSELVKIRNDVITIYQSRLDLIPILIEKSSLIDTLLKLYPTAQYINELSSEFQLLIEQASNINDTVNKNLKLLDEQIEIVGDDLLSDPSYRKQFSILDLHQKCKPSVSIPDFKIKKYCSWQYPSLQLPVHNKPCIDAMVASDPLYLVGDLNHIISLINEYPVQYQNRLRCYNLIRRATSNQPELYYTDVSIESFTRVLPNNQFRFILAWEFFNQLSHDKIQFYLDQLLKLLRPGGVVMFNYNNGHLLSTAELIEKRYISFCTKTIIEKLALNTGFEIIEFTDELSDETNLYTSYVELRKPGSLSTIKAHTVLGEIKQK